MNWSIMAGFLYPSNLGFGLINSALIQDSTLLLSGLCDSISAGSDVGWTEAGFPLIEVSR